MTYEELLAAIIKTIKEINLTKQLIADSKDPLENRELLRALKELQYLQRGYLEQMGW